jgi:chlorophyllase
MKFSMGQLLRFGIACLLTVAGHQAYAAGEASVKELIIKTKQGVKVDTLVMYPEQSSADELGVVVMNHGFLMSNSYYRDVLSEIANHGFVIVAPQTIAPGGLPIGKPSTAVEARSTAEVINWMSSNLSGLVGKSVDFDKLALVNHSRGSKVAWTMLRDGLIDAKAIAAIDPVDGTQDGTGLATTGVQLKVPALIIGTGLGGKKNLGQACAPENVNYKLFWNTVSDSPSWLFVANDYGHMDFLDEKINCGMTCNLCVGAAKDKSRPDLRSWMGQTIGSYLRGVLHGDSNALDSVEDNPMNLSLTKANR